jgi:FkbM family methyltransferase
LGIKRRAVNTGSGLLRWTIGLTGSTQAPRISAQLAEDLTPMVVQQTKHGEIRFFCPGQLPEWRARTLLTKEPETLEWIEGFADGDVLWDIGANVGAYSLYAGAKGHSVLSFEPSPSNYYVLCKNIEANQLDDHILAYCVAFAESTRLDTFYMANTDLGGALSSFGEATDWRGQPFNAEFRQAMVGYSVDDFVSRFEPQFPNHIKIDVDGIEDQIVAGAKTTLADRRLKSVLVELDTDREDYCRGVVEVLEASGLALAKKEHAPDYESGEYSSAYNHIFERSQD